jgi:hypothetical protein
MVLLPKNTALPYLGGMQGLPFQKLILRLVNGDIYFMVSFLSFKSFICASYIWNSLISFAGFSDIGIQDGSVSIVMVCGLHGQGSIHSRGKKFIFLHSIQTDSGDHPATYPMGTRGSFHGGKAARA